MNGCYEVADDTLKQINALVEYYKLFKYYQEDGASDHQKLTFYESTIELLIHLMNDYNDWREFETKAPDSARKTVDINGVKYDPTTGLVIKEQHD